MADLARTAIENEQKLQQQLILEDKDFVVDWVSRQVIGFSRFMITYLKLFKHFYLEFSRACNCIWTILSLKV